MLRQRIKNITIMVEAFEDRKLYHNPRWTAEALENILDNAVKYSPSGSIVTVRVYPMELYTQIEITDQGIGIPRGEYNKIFQRFTEAAMRRRRRAAVSACIWPS